MFSEQVVERLIAVMDEYAPNLDDQLNTALALVRAIRAKRYRLAKEIQESMDLKTTRPKIGEVRL
jgi:ADP-heptose:LPS heptosyltransferase